MAGKLANGHGGMTSRGATVTLWSAGRFSIDQLDLARYKIVRLEINKQ